jgi:YVTN family beta-propeller protein
MSRTTTTGARLAGLLLATVGLAHGAGAQPVTDRPIQELLDSLRAHTDPDGNPAAMSWVLESASFGGGGPRACAPWTGVGSDPEGDSASGAAFGPDGSWFVLAHRDSRNLLVYDADTRALVREIPLSGSPVDLAVSANGQWAVTANLFEDTASIVDLASGTELAVLPVGEGPITCRVTPDGTRALVGSMVGDDVAVIDLASQTEVRRIGGLNFGVVLSANGESWAVQFGCSNPLELADSSTAIFPDLFGDRIVFVDLATGALNAVPTSDQPRAVAVNAAGTVAAVSHAFGTSNNLDVVDIASQTVARSINVGTACYGPVTLDPSGGKAVVAVQNAVRVVNLNTSAVGGNLNTASVNQLLTTADGLHALCVGFNGSLISFGSETLVKHLNQFVSTAIGAVSPADARAVMLATTFGEQMVVVNTAGASGFREEVRPSGPGPEGDKPRTAAVTPSGSRVLTANQFSENVSVFHGGTGALLGHAEAGLRTGQVRATPDGSRAVVTNRDDTVVTVIDLATLAASDVTISTRGDQLAISPDSTYAYIAVVTSDGVWRVNLDTLSVEGAKLPVGEMGGAGYTGNQFSGMSLSHDGSTIVACNSFDDTITIIDADAWAVVKTVTVGDFPTCATFSPDDAEIYVTNRTSETVSVVSNAGAGSAVIGSVGVGGFPYLSVTSGDGSVLYVMNTGDKTVSVIDTGSLTETAVVPLSTTPIGMVFDGAGNRLLVGVGTASADTNGNMTQSGGLEIIDAASNTVVETICADHFLSELAADADAGLVAGAGLGGESVVFFELASCAVDLNGDGLVNTQDFILYLNLWASGDLGADWDGNGVVNTVDFIAYLNGWAAGC